MFGALILFRDEFIHVMSISFTALIFTELIMVALTIRNWHYLMILAELFSILLYLISLIVLKEYFDLVFIRTLEFLWKTALITAVSCLPLYILKFLRKKFSPPSYQKLSWTRSGTLINIWIMMKSKDFVNFNRRRDNNNNCN